jgi:predicted MFS family arabinose efflux permease
VPAAERAPAVLLPGVTAREGLRSATFIKIAAASFFGNVVLVAAMFHLIPLLGSTGVPRSEAIRLAGLVGVATVIGKMISGVLVDRMRGNVIAAIFVALPIVTCAILLMPTESLALRLTAVAALGLSVGGQVHMLSYLATRYFGLRAYGTIAGFLNSIIAIAVGVGPVLAGYVFDRSHNYGPALIAGIPLSVIGALLMLSLGRYPDAPAPAEQLQPLGSPKPVPAK